MIKVYVKKSGTKLSEHFNSDEFDCHCSNKSCNETLIDELSIERLEKMRKTTNRKITIHSGFRCVLRQDKIKQMGLQTIKGKISTHEQGMAQDFEIDGLTGPEMEIVARLAGFTSVGIAASWIHADTRTGYRCWTYPEVPIVNKSQ